MIIMRTSIYKCHFPTHLSSKTRRHNSAAFHHKTTTQQVVKHHKKDQLATAPSTHQQWLAQNKISIKTRLTITARRNSQVMDRRIPCMQIQLVSLMEVFPNQQIICKTTIFRAKAADIVVVKQYHEVEKEKKTPTLVAIDQIKVQTRDIATAQSFNKSHENINKNIIKT